MKLEKEEIGFAEWFYS